MRATVRRVLAIGAAGLLLGLAVLWSQQHRFIYLPSDDWFAVDLDAAGVQEITYTTTDGVEHTGWLVPSAQPVPPCGATPLVVLLHGQGGNRSWHYPSAKAIAAHGPQVLIAEYRGYGGSAGTPSEDGLILDARAALEAARRLPGVDPDRIVVMGVSLGSGIAVAVGATEPVAGLVLVSPYTSLPDAAWVRWPVLPYRLLLRDHFDTMARIERVEAPVLVVLGTEDEIVPPEQSRRVHAAAPAADALVEVQGAGHHATELRIGEDAIGPIADAVTRWTGCPPG